MGRTNVPEAICPSNFFELGGITRLAICGRPSHQFKGGLSSVIAVFSWALCSRNKGICIQSDNMMSVSAICHGTSKKTNIFDAMSPHYFLAFSCL